MLFLAAWHHGAACAVSLSVCAAGALFRVTMLLLISIAKPCVEKVAEGIRGLGCHVNGHWKELIRLCDRIVICSDEGEPGVCEVFNGSILILCELSKA